MVAELIRASNPRQKNPNITINRTEYSKEIAEGALKENYLLKDLTSFIMLGQKGYSAPWGDGKGKGNG